MMKKNKSIKKSQAYTIIEAMIVVLVLSLLATLGVAGYKRYMAKTLVAQAITATLPLQQVIQDFYQHQGFLPGNQDLTGPPGYGPTGPFGLWEIDNPIPDVATIRWYTDGPNNCIPNTVGCDDENSSTRRQIEIYFNPTTSIGNSFLGGKIFILRANLSAGGLSWICRTYDYGDPGFRLDDTLLPRGCFG
jgi:type II secretory pathway pseudopilin PulG